jgi:hypothetical protein
MSQNTLFLARLSALEAWGFCCGESKELIHLKLVAELLSAVDILSPEAPISSLKCCMRLYAHYYFVSPFFWCLKSTCTANLDHYVKNSGLIETLLT